jgi:hypothetical protein
MRNSAFSTGTYKEGLFHCHVTQHLGDQPQSAERHSDRHLRSLREFLFGQGIVELLGRDEQLMNSWWWTMDLAALLCFFSKSSMIDWLVTSFRTVLCQTIWSFGDWFLPAFPWFLDPKHSGGGQQQPVHDLGWLRFGKQGSIFWNVEIGLYQNGGIHQFLAIFKGDNDEKSWVG